VDKIVSKLVKKMRDRIGKEYEDQIETAI